MKKDNKKSTKLKDLAVYALVDLIIGIILILMEKVPACTGIQAGDSSKGAYPIYKPLHTA